MYSVLSVLLLFCLIHGSRNKAGKGEQAESVDGGENFILNTTATKTLLLQELKHRTITRELKIPLASCFFHRFRIMGLIPSIFENRFLNSLRSPS